MSDTLLRLVKRWAEFTGSEELWRAYHNEQHSVWVMSQVEDLLMDEQIDVGSEVFNEDIQNMRAQLLDHDSSKAFYYVAYGDGGFLVVAHEKGTGSGNYYDYHDSLSEPSKNRDPFAHLYTVTHRRPLTYEGIITREELAKLDEKNGWGLSEHVARAANHSPLTEIVETQDFRGPFPTAELDAAFFEMYGVDRRSVK